MNNTIIFKSSFARVINEYLRIRQSQGDKQCKVRNNKLEKYYAVDFGKDSLENGFEINARREAERTATTERARQQRDKNCSDISIT